MERSEILGEFIESSFDFRLFHVTENEGDQILEVLFLLGIVKLENLSSSLLFNLLLFFTKAFND